MWNCHWSDSNDFKCLFLKPSCAFPVCHDTEERCRLVLSYVLEVSLLVAEGSPAVGFLSLKHKVKISFFQLKSNVVFKIQKLLNVLSSPDTAYI